MAFVGMEQFIGDISKSLTLNIGKKFKGTMKNIGGMIGNQTKKAKKFSKSMKKGGGQMMGYIGVIMRIADALGIAEPFLQMFSGILSIIGGSIMQALMPAIQKLMDILFSPEMMALWTLLGDIIGQMLAPIIEVFAVVLKALMPILKLFLELLGPIMIPIVTLLAKVLGILIIVGLLPLMYALYGVSLFIAGIIDLFTGKKTVKKVKRTFKPILEGMMVGLGEILEMQHGGYVPSGEHLAVLHGPEVVIPLDKGGVSTGGNRDLLWATEDNGEKLDMIIGVLRQGRRLR